MELPKQIGRYIHVIAENKGDFNAGRVLINLYEGEKFPSSETKVLVDELIKRYNAHENLSEALMLYHDAYTENESESDVMEKLEIACKKTELILLEGN